MSFSSSNYLCSDSSFILKLLENGEFNKQRVTLCLSTFFLTRSRRREGKE